MLVVVCKRASLREMSSFLGEGGSGLPRVEVLTAVHVDGHHVAAAVPKAAGVYSDQKNIPSPLSTEKMA